MHIRLPTFINQMFRCCTCTVYQTTYSFYIAYSYIQATFKKVFKACKVYSQKLCHIMLQDRYRRLRTEIVIMATVPWIDPIESQLNISHTDIVRSVGRSQRFRSFMWVLLFSAVLWNAAPRGRACRTGWACRVICETVRWQFFCGMFIFSSLPNSKSARKR